MEKMNGIKGPVAIVDPVGVKAGMDIYDLQLLQGLAGKGIGCMLLSNSDRHDPSVTVINVFKNGKLKGVRSGLAILAGLTKSLFLLKRKRTAWVLLHLFRSDWLELFTQLLFYLGGIKVCIIVHDIESLDTVSFPFIRKLTLNHFHNLRIVHNRFALSEIKKYSTLQSMQRTEVIPHGNFTELSKTTIDRQAALKHFNLNENNRYLLFFGQIKKAKGLDVLLKAFVRAHTPYCLIIAGKDRDDRLSNYQHEIHELTKANRIYIFNRHLTDEERTMLFVVSDGVILPYRRIYQSGVLLMAMSFGKAVIASDLPPFTEMLNPDEQTGYLFRSEDAESLCQVIEQLHEHNLEETGRRAFDHVSLHYNREKIAGLYLSVLGK